jgi:hypoxanthine phosphoribosyltransferase
MGRVQVRELFFENFIPREKIEMAVQKVADEINRDYAGKEPLLLAVLNGAFMFASDLMKKITIPCEITFVKFSSYVGIATTEEVKELIGVDNSVEGRDVIIIEDIIDTGITLEKIMAEVGRMGPSSMKIAAFCFKPEAFRKSYPIDYLGLEIPNNFIVGYGLDYNGFGRNLPDIYTLVESGEDK